MKKGEIYKERGVHRKRGGDKSVKNKQKKAFREESEQCNFLYNPSLLGQACGGKYVHLFYKISLFLLYFYP